MIHSDNKGYIPGQNKEEQSSPAPQKNMGKGYEEKAATGRTHAENMDENERRNLNADQEKRSEKK